MPKEPKQKVKREKVLGAQYYHSGYGYSDSKQRAYLDTITDPDYPYDLYDYEIEEALEEIEWYKKMDGFIPENWQRFLRNHQRTLRGYYFSDFMKSKGDSCPDHTSSNSSVNSPISTKDQKSAEKKSWVQNIIDNLFPTLEASPGISTPLANEYNAHILEHKTISDQPVSSSPLISRNGNLSFEEIFAWRDRLYQWEGAGADPELVNMGRASQQEIARRLGINPAHMKDTWCFAMVQWAVLQADGANVEESPLDFFLKHASTKIDKKWGAKIAGKPEIIGETGYVNAQDLIAYTYLSSGSKLGFKDVTLSGSKDHRYRTLVEFLRSTNQRGVHLRVSESHSIALLRPTNLRVWKVWDTSARNTNGTIFDPEETAYKDSALYKNAAYGHPERYFYYPVK